MADKEARGFCSHCEKQVLVRKKRTNHVLHAILSIITVGTWIIIWLLCGWACARKPWRCTICGEKSKKVRDGGDMLKVVGKHSKKKRLKKEKMDIIKEKIDASEEAKERWAKAREEGIEEEEIKEEEVKLDVDVKTMNEKAKKKYKKELKKIERGRDGFQL